jgi:hypothetical protein
MGGFVTDILMPGVAGAGKGFSQGIHDYSNIQKIRREEEQAPVTAELNRINLTQAQRQEKEAALRDTELNKPWNPYEEPLYKASTPEGQAFIQSAFPQDKQYTVRDKMNFAQQIPANQQIFKHITEAATNISAGKKTQAVNEYNTILEKIASTPTTDPNYQTLVQSLTPAKANMEKVNDEHDKITNNFKKGESQVAINELYVNNRALIDSSPALKMMTDLTRQTGDVQGMEKVIETIAKAKDPQIKNDIELAIAAETENAKKQGRAFSANKALDLFKQTKKEIKIDAGGNKPTDADKEYYDYIRQFNVDKKAGKYADPKQRPFTRGEYKSYMSSATAGNTAKAKKPQRNANKMTFNPATGEIE